MAQIGWPEILIAIVLLAVLTRICSGMRLYRSEESEQAEESELSVDPLAARRKRGYRNHLKYSTRL